MFFFNDTATTEIYTLSLHDALPILTQPGLLIVCGDSHTSTHGALGALAFGIGSTEVTHVLATQTLWQRKPKTLRITVDGALAEGVTAKDLILAIIARVGAAEIGRAHV